MLQIKHFLHYCVFVLFFASSIVLSLIDDGKHIFNNKCSVCHTIGGGKLVGPDLQDVHKKYNNTWLKQFILSSSSMIRQADEKALLIFNQYNKIIMPDHNLSDRQLVDLIQYIVKASDLLNMSTIDNVDTANDKALANDDVLLGKNLFLGYKSFKNAGPACLSCHNINLLDSMSGGSLAVDLTKVFDRIGAKGIESIIKSSPFPAMNIAYNNYKLEENEVIAVRSFLQDLNARDVGDKIVNYSINMIGIGIVGVFVLSILLSFIWMKRKKHGVNDEIYNRQIRSQ